MQKTLTETIKLTPKEITDILQEKFGYLFSVTYNLVERTDGFIGYKFVGATLKKDEIKPV